MKIFKLYISIYQEDIKDGQNLKFPLYFLYLSERIISKTLSVQLIFITSIWHRFLKNALRQLLYSYISSKLILNLMQSTTFLISSL